MPACPTRAVMAASGGKGDVRWSRSEELKELPFSRNVSPASPQSSPSLGPKYHMRYNPDPDYLKDAGSRGVVDVSTDTDSEIAEVVDITAVDSEDEIPQAPAEPPPQRFHGYRRGRELGRGATGQVFICHKKGCAGGFAVKTVNMRRLQLRPNAEIVQQKVRREVAILKRLPHHRNIVQLVDAFEEGDWLLLVLELVGGGDLYTVLTSRPCSRFREMEAAYVLFQLIDGLSFLHREGVIHRDLKLENVLVASEQLSVREQSVLYTVKISDFGLSKSVGDGISEARSTVGTRPYTAPEVLREGLHDFSSDIWCLGILLHVLVAGKFPFDEETPAQDELDRLVDCIPDLSESACFVLHSLLQVDSAKRRSLEELERSSSAWLSTFGPQDAIANLLGRSDRDAKRRRMDESSLGDAPLSQPISICNSEISVRERKLPESPLASSSNRKPTVAIDGSFIDVDAVTSPVGAKPSPEVAALMGMSSPLPDPEGGYSVPLGAWTPFAEEAAATTLSGVRPPSERPEVIQVHMVVPSHLAGNVLGKSGAKIQQIAASASCQVWMTSREGRSVDRRVVIIGNFKQCKVAQELVHEQIAIGLQKDWQDTLADVYLLVRKEAAGVVTGKRGFVLNQIKAQSGARIQLLQTEVEGQRLCRVQGTLTNVIRAERHVFDLVKNVPVATRSE